MVKRRSLFVSAVLLAAPLAAQDVTPMQAWGGRVALAFHEGALQQAGLELLALEETAEVAGADVELMTGDLMGFRIRDDSDLMALRGADGSFVPYGVLGGEVSVHGGFVLHAPGTGGVVDLHGFSIRAEVVRNDGPGGEPDPDYFVLSAAAGPGADAFDLCYVKVLFADTPGYQPDGGAEGGGHAHGPPQLVVKAFDLVATPWLARQLGRPDLAGRALGAGKVEADVAVYEGDWSLPPGQNPLTPYTGQQAAGGADGTCCAPYRDVKLGILSSIQQVGHVGTFPNGRTGMSMATTSCNVGDENVPWLQPMNENHPGIAMALYREMDGRFEQVGVSWIKHGFFALSNSQCTPCQNPTGGFALGVGCSDTYGVSNNSDTFYLGPRDEWNPFTAEWACLGSFFDGAPADCVRDEFGNGTGSVNHRLEAFDADLGLPGATYVYEAMYLVREDGDIRNNIGSRLCTMTWNGFAWQFSTPGGNPLIEGPAVERWGEMHTEAGIGEGDGKVVLAVDTTDLGGGLWRYEYALFNWNAHRRPGAFSVPVQGPVTDVTFHDVDGSAANDWVATLDGNQITWTFPDVFVGGHKEAGPLRFGTLYNFGFTSVHPPADRTAAIDLYDDGPGGARFSAATRGPAVLGLSADVLAPAVGETATLLAQGGSDTLGLLLLEVNGVPVTPLILGFAPFAGGQAAVPVVVPPEAAGLTFSLLGFDVGVPGFGILGVSNVADLAVQ